jgi:hypothetical protein
MLEDLLLVGSGENEDWDSIMRLTISRNRINDPDKWRGLNGGDICAFFSSIFSKVKKR